MSSCRCPVEEFDIDQDQYDQDKYWGRVKHFFKLTNPLNLFATNARLERARTIVLKVRCREPLQEYVSDHELWRAKSLYDSAFHPSTGERLPFIGRVSGQVATSALIIGSMLTYQCSSAALAFWQLVYQTYLTMVYRATKGTEMQISEKQMNTQYLLSSVTAVATALGLRKYGRQKCVPPLLLKYIPFVAIFAATSVNVPLLKSQELKYGTPIYDEYGRKLGYSSEAAASGIYHVVLSRMALLAPGMISAPLVIDYLEKRGSLCRYPWLPLPVNIGIMAFSLMCIAPFTYAFFNRKGEMKFRHLEPKLQTELRQRYNNLSPKYVYFDKGM